MNNHTLAVAVIATLAVAASLPAQHAHGAHTPPADSARLIGTVDEAMSGELSEAARKHMELTPTRRATAADSARALAVANEVRTAIAKYADTAAATAAGYRMFLPGLKSQKVYHFTNYRHAMAAAFSFDPAKPTSLLYRRGSNGQMELIGAMFTAPRRVRTSRLDGRVPLSIAQWHKHVNWCVPRKGEEGRWLEQRDGKPVFGPESSIATKKGCDAAGGQFHENLFGWMLHANVFLGDDLATVYGHGH